ncbi:MAG TPA: hypothetical protein PLL69_04440 [Gemmatimonadales bacterium]|nr:hypothetical protein [Gemmatimonadales bacterium]
MMPAITRTVPALTVLLTAITAAAPLAAQVDEQLWRWVNSQGSVCVWYLADPAVAPGLVPEGVTLRPATATASLPESMLRIVQDEPRFADWIPGMLCIGRFAVVAADGNPVGEMREGQSHLLVLSALAAASPFGQDAGWQLASIGLRAGRLDQVAEVARIGSESAQFRTRVGVEGEDDEWELSFDGLKLIWRGHPTGQPRVGTTQTMSFGYAGERNTAWLVALRSNPETEQGQVGSFRVEGKNPLAQALKSSPIRSMGPVSGGGELTLTFRRLGPDGG